MTQHDLDIANQTFPATRQDFNAALEALGTCQAGASAPATTFPGMLWLDTTNAMLRQRNIANNAWLVLFEFAGNVPVLRGTVQLNSGSAAAPGMAFTSDPDTGVFRPTTDTVALSAGGTEQVRVTPDIVRIYAADFLANIARVTTAFRGPDGSEATPAFAFQSTPSRGMYNAGDGRIGFATGGATIATISADGVRSYSTFRAPDGVSATPAYTFQSATDTGLYIDSNGNLAISIKGLRRLVVGSSNVELYNGARFSGDGSGITDLAASAVGAAIASQAVGGTGTYAMLSRKSGTGGFSTGTVYAGSLLAYAGADDNGNTFSGTSPSGSWQCCGYVAGGNSSPTTLFKRV